MKVNLIRLFAIATIGLSAPLLAWEPGYVPKAPARMAVSGFDVDNFDRNDVVAFWHGVYQASEGYEKRVKWSGNYVGNNGTTSREFVDDVERRVNYFRAMCGLGSQVSVNSGAKVVIGSLDAYKPPANATKSQAAQDAALMMIRNYNPTTGSAPALTHNPPPGLSGWSPTGWNGLAKGNFVFGIYGPGAITEYMVEKTSAGQATSSWNSQVGHRRWCLYPGATDFATGDQPGESAFRPPTNVFYVVPDSSEITGSAAAGFVAYPPAGYFPAEVNSPFWSLSREGADFSRATVRMTDAGGRVVPVTRIASQNGYGDPALMWRVSGAAASESVSRDTRFNVEVFGISSESAPSTYSYSVTLIDPDQLLSSQRLSGPGKVAAGKTASYFLKPPARAEAISVAVYKKSKSPWKEDAENRKKTKVIDQTGGNYPLLAKGNSFAGFGSVSGKSSFHLTFSSAYDPIKRGVPEQSFELDREIISKSRTRLSFDFRRGFMTRGSVLVVESSSDGGVSWKKAGSPITGVSDTRVDSFVSSVDIRLPKSKKPLRLRFRYYTKGGIIFTHGASPKLPTGIFIDDITVKGGEWLEPGKVSQLPPSAGRFVLDTRKVGGKVRKGDKLVLSMRTKLGGKWFPDGPPKPVSISR